MTRRRPGSGRVLTLTLTLTLALATLAGCSRKGHLPPPAPQARLDRAVMACLGALRAYHRQADVRLEQRDRDAATRAMNQFLELPCLDRPNPEIREAVLDAYGRLARLHLQQGHLTQAASVLEQGLARPGPDSFFRANLLLTQGDVIDAQAKEAEQRGDKAQADGLRRAAIGAFDRSAVMNKHLLERLVP